jgi:hypothetical protein
MNNWFYFNKKMYFILNNLVLNFSPNLTVIQLKVVQTYYIPKHITIVL